MYSVNSETIEFFWDTDRIFDMVSYKTGIQAKKDDEMVGVITDDKREYVVENLRPIFVKLYGYFLDVSLSMPNVLYVHAPNAILGVFLSGFTVVCRRNAKGELLINEQRLNTISSLCQEYVVSEVIRKWSEDNDLEELRKIATVDSQAIIVDLEKNMKYLKKRAYLRSFS